MFLQGTFNVTAFTFCGFAVVVLPGVASLEGLKEVCLEGVLNSRFPALYDGRNFTLRHLRFGKPEDFSNVDVVKLLGERSHGLWSPHGGGRHGRRGGVGWTQICNVVWWSR